MSDFGSLIIVTKEDNSIFLENEIVDISTELENIITNNNYSNSLGEAFDSKFYESSGDEIPTIIALLSEYYFGGNQDEDKETFDFVKDTELEEAQEIVSKLEIIFSDFIFTANVEEW